MNPDDLHQFGQTICRNFADYIDKNFVNAAGTRADFIAEAARKKILLAVDEGIKALSRVKQSIEDGTILESVPAPENATIRGKGLLDTLQTIIALALKHPDKLAKHYAQFAGQALAILRGGSDLEPEPADFRFKDGLWNESRFFQILLQLYLAWDKQMQGWLDDQTLDADDKKRIGFIFEQLVAAVSPSNLPLNPAALKRVENTEGESAVKGLRHFIGDIIHNRGMPSQIKPDAYEVGKDLALSEGAVVYRNACLELIQYAPQTPQVRANPVLLVPPQINKYYIFDLKPKSSIVAHLVKAGLPMFAISWKNPQLTDLHWNLAHYVSCVIEAIGVVLSITGADKLNLISGCAGGLTTMAALGALAERGDRRIGSHTLFVTSLFANYGSVLELFATPEALEATRAYAQIDGVMDGRELARVFAWLRPNDLVWRYWVNNYLMGKQPPSLDVLFWDNDPTRLPAALHGDFIDMYLNDVFRRDGALVLDGLPIDFRKVAVDTYYVGGTEDYLMPWQGCYRAYTHFKGEHRFVLSTSGHIQSILRPPNIPRTGYYLNADKPDRAEDWLAGSRYCEGSWWGDWHDWLGEKSGAMRPSPETLGNPDYPTLMKAPGSYVFERI